MAAVHSSEQRQAQVSACWQRLARGCVPAEEECQLATCAADHIDSLTPFSCGLLIPIRIPLILLPRLHWLKGPSFCHRPGAVADAGW